MTDAIKDRSLSREQISKQFEVREWVPRKGLGIRFFRKTNMKKTWNLISCHPPNSITWLWFVQFSLGNKRWWFYHCHKYPNGGGSASIGLFKLFGLSYHWQRRMNYRPQLQCVKQGCFTTIDESDTTYCCRKGCLKREGLYRRAIWRAWFNHQPTEKE